MPAAFSNEGRIDTTLRELDCSQREFVETAKQLGIQISQGGFSDGMRSVNGFRRELGERLLEVAKRMSDLDRGVRESIGVPINWSATSRVVKALVIRQVQRIAAEAHHDHSLDLLEQRATSAVTK